MPQPLFLPKNEPSIPVSTTAPSKIEEETVRYSQGVETIEIRPEELAAEVFEDNAEDPLPEEQPVFPR